MLKRVVFVGIGGVFLTSMFYCTVEQLLRFDSAAFFEMIAARVFPTK